MRRKPPRKIICLCIKYLVKLTIHLHVYYIMFVLVVHIHILQVIRLREMFPQGPGFLLVFDYMLSDLSEVIRNTEKPLTEVIYYIIVLVTIVTIVL